MKKKTSQTTSEKAEEKGIFYQAGEIIGSIGFHIVDGKDKLVGVVKKKLGKKKPSPSKSKKALKKASAQKAGKKIIRKVKKVLPVKSAEKKTDRVKKVAKKTAKKL